ncbi:hypothetical protein E5221_07010 [Pseudomonas sp. A2]|nr:hypothetical protein E5221_07010 [Pseudomonas sp. A2]
MGNALTGKRSRILEGCTGPFAGTPAPTGISHALRVCESGCARERPAQQASVGICWPPAKQNNKDV